MTEVGIRALKQNASAVVAPAATGESITIADRGRPVAQPAPLAASPLARLIESGRARPPRLALGDLSLPTPVPGLSDELSEQRGSSERFGVETPERLLERETSWMR